MKRTLLIVFLLLIQVRLFSQTKELDSLLTVYKNSKTEKAQVHNGLDLLWKYRMEGYLEEGLALGKKMIELSKKLKSDSFLAEAYYRTSVIYDDRGSYDTSIMYAKKAIEMHLVQKEYKRLIDDYVTLSGSYYNTTQYNNSLETSFKALTIAEKVKAEDDIAQLYNNMANIYKDLDNISKSYMFRQKSLNTYRKLKHKQGIAIIYTNMAYDLSNMQDSALKTLKFSAKSLNDTIAQYSGRAYKHFEEINMPVGKAAVLGNLGLWLSKIGQYDSALVCEKRCYEIYKSLDMHLDMAAALGDLSMVYNGMKNYKEAIKAGLMAEKLSEETNNRFALTQIYKNLYLGYKGIGSVDRALFYHENWKIIYDSLKGEEENRALTLKALQYDFNKKALADSLKAAEVKQMDEIKHEKEIAVQRTYTYAGVIGFILMIIIAGVSFKAFKQKQKDNIVISQQKHIVEEHQKEILDSIHYAKRIQSAILAKPEEVKQYLPESFLIYKPKDIVAGDFYFFETTTTHLFYAAADCTGHGVPGALVSVVCSNALSRCVKEFGLSKPGEILTKARELVLETFRKSGENVKDGMDISLISIAKSELGKGITNIQWAGAFNPLWYSVGNEMKEIKANKQPIGLSENQEPFTTHELKLEKGNIFYLFTDGYADQFGGPKGKKFKYKQMEELLLSESAGSLDSQADVIVKRFEEWRGSLEQVDDVCVIGVRV